MERTVVPATVHHAHLAGSLRPREMATLDERIAMLEYDPPYEPQINELREIYLEDVHRVEARYYTPVRLPVLYHAQPPIDRTPDRSDRLAYAWHLHRQTGGYVAVAAEFGVTRQQARTMCCQYIRRASALAGVRVPTHLELRSSKARKARP